MFQIKVVEKIKTHFTTNNFFSENRAVYEIMWKNIVEPETDEKIRRMRVAFCVTVATPARTYTQYATLIAVHCNNDFVNAPPCYVIRTLPVLLFYNEMRVMKLGKFL